MPNVESHSVKNTVKLDKELVRRTQPIVNWLSIELAKTLFGSFVDAAPGTQRSIDTTTEMLKQCGSPTVDELELVLNNSPLMNGVRVKKVTFRGDYDMPYVQITLTKDAPLP